MRSLGASRLAMLWKAELPASLPFIFSGLKLAATVSVIGAVFAEFSGADTGLGRLVLLANNQLQTPARRMPATVLLMLMSIALFAFVSLVERIFVPWKGTPCEARSACLLVLAAVALAGCGEKKDALRPATRGRSS